MLDHVNLLTALAAVYRAEDGAAMLIGFDSAWTILY